MTLHHLLFYSFSGHYESTYKNIALTSPSPPLSSRIPSFPESPLFPNSLSPPPLSPPPLSPLPSLHSLSPLPFLRPLSPLSPLLYLRPLSPLPSLFPPPPSLPSPLSPPLSPLPSLPSPLSPPLSPLPSLPSPLSPPLSPLPSLPSPLSPPLSPLPSLPSPLSPPLSPLPSLPSPLLSLHTLATHIHYDMYFFVVDQRPILRSHPVSADALDVRGPCRVLRSRRDVDRSLHRHRGGPGPYRHHRVCHCGVLLHHTDPWREHAPPGAST